MINLPENSQPGSHDLVILFGPDSVLLDTLSSHDLGIEKDPIILRGDFDLLSDLNHSYIPYRNAIKSLNLSQLEVEYSRWFAGLMQFIQQYSARANGIEYESVNLLYTESLAIYLRIYEFYEEFTCAKLLLEELQPRSILVIASSPESIQQPFTRLLRLLAGQKRIPVRQVLSEGKADLPKRSYPTLVFKALQKEAVFLRIAIQNRLRGQKKTRAVFCVEENAYNIPVYLPAFVNSGKSGASLNPYYLTNNPALYKELNPPQIGISPYEGFSLPNLFKYLSLIRRYLSAADNLLKDTQFHQFFCWNGTDVWLLVRDGLRKLFIQKNIMLLWYLIMIDSLLVRLKPEAVITTYGLAHFRNAVIELAKNRHIPTLIIQNAAVPHQLLWGLRPEHPMLVWGQATKDFLVSVGADKEKLHVIGPTKYTTESSSLAEIDREQEVERLGFRYDLPLLLYMANFTGAWGQYYDWETTDMLLRIINRQPRYQLMITLHPRCPEKIFENLARIESDRIRILKKPNMPVLYRIADVGITQFSTTAIDASMYGLPIINVLTHNRPDWLGMGQLGAAMIARDEEGLMANIELILNNDDFRRKIRHGQQEYRIRYLNNLKNVANLNINEFIHDIV